VLIAAYAGCGKSTAAQKLGPDVLDLPSMPYRWLLPLSEPSRDAPEREREKGALHHIEDPRFPCNYVLEILKAERTGKTVLFPTIVPVINLLVERYGRDVLVACPEKGLKDEYRRRYLERGNSGSFLRIFIDGWDEWLESIGQSKGRHLRLKSGEYLLPVLLGALDGGPAAPPVPDAALAELERETAEQGRNQALWMLHQQGEIAACLVEDLDAPAVREILDAIGRAAYERDLYPPRFVAERKISKYGEAFEGIVWCKHLDEFYQTIIAVPVPPCSAGGCCGELL